MDQYCRISQPKKCEEPCIIAVYRTLKKGRRDAQSSNQQRFETHKFRKLLIIIYEKRLTALQEVSTLTRNKRDGSVSDVWVFVSCYQDCPHYW